MATTLHLASPLEEREKIIEIKHLHPREKTTGGKRGPSAPLVTTSDEDEAVDHSSSVDYENVSSPGNSSTASGPVYIRPPGFEHHAHEIRKTKIKKKKNVLTTKEGFKKRDPTPPKTKPKREPLPMRLRALPQSFWQQPNVPHNVSPGASYPTLPPLIKENDEEALGDVRPVTPPEEKREKKPSRPSERKITIANPDLLLQLFDGIGDNGRSSKFKRGRPKKVQTGNKTIMTGEDPYLVEAVTEKLFPQLSLERGKHQSSSVNSGTTLQLIRFREGDKSVMLPSLANEQNYSQMLSELVMHI